MDVRGVRHSDRFLLWIDAVGGYWVCLGNEVMLGQPEGGRAVDVPILGDLSTRHARIRRDGDGYLIEALHEVRIDDRPVQTMGWLATAAGFNWAARCGWCSANRTRSAARPGSISSAVTAPSRRPTPCC